MFRLVLVIAIATFATAFVANPSRSTTSSSLLFSEKGIIISISIYLYIYLYFIFSIYQYQYQPNLYLYIIIIIIIINYLLLLNKRYWFQL